jgi:hypothetical protein
MQHLRIPGEFGIVLETCTPILLKTDSNLLSLFYRGIAAMLVLPLRPVL